MLVRGVVVADEMQCLALGRFAIDLAQEAQPFLVTMTLLTLGVRACSLSSAQPSGQHRPSPAAHRAVGLAQCHAGTIAHSVRAIA
jgi:hypothetical protein